jgi:TPP-dependent pyruvate/acetoin dehydrogenase alpha subunit
MERDTALQLYRTMVRIRAFEVRAEQLFLAGKLPGFIHLSIGQEAIPAGVTSQLRVDDYIAVTHRGHGHVIAKGGDMRLMMAELFGRSTGYNRGKGGSMHLMAADIGMLGANGIVGATFSLAGGAALAAKLTGSQQIAVAVFGDGGANRGTFHESLNLAAAWRLPLLAVCENNRWASTTPFGTSKVDGPWPVHSTERIADRAVAYGIPGLTVDGNDVEEVYTAASELIARARRGEGPAILECLTYRLRGHYVGDRERYRDRREIAEALEREPIGRWEAKLKEWGYADEAQLEAVRLQAEAEVEEAVVFAEASPWPDPAEATTDVFCRPLLPYPWEEVYGQ